MITYKNAIKTVEQYLYLIGDIDTSEHVKPGEYRMLINNWRGCCESYIKINIDPQSNILSYKMYYNSVTIKNDFQRDILTEYFKRVEKPSIYNNCRGGIESNGAVYVEIKYKYNLYSFTCKLLQQFEEICTDRIYDDRYIIKRIGKLDGKGDN